MDETPEPAETPNLKKIVDALEREEYDVDEPLPGVLHVTGRFSNPERIALGAAAQADDAPVAIWARSHRNDWTLVCWRRPDLVTITQREAAPQRWRHRRLPPTLNPDAQTFLEGASSPFDIVTRPKHQPTDAAREVIAGFGITETAPPGWVPPVVEPVVVRETKLPTATAKPKRVATPKALQPEPKKQEPEHKICPTCFMALPATGICDNCG